MVDDIVSLAHGRGEKAGRLEWSAVARARHSRSEGESEPGLDLLEKYLQLDKSLTREQVENWASDYPVTVLNEAMQKMATLFGAKNASDMANRYPSTILNRGSLERILLHIDKATFSSPT